MLDKFFEDIFDNTVSSAISMGDFLICIGVALVLGLIFAASYTVKSRYTNSFIMTVAIIPAIVCTVIMMVNGSIGAGVAIAGAFSLVRFRSAPGSAREIAAIFLSMVAGLMCGMGYVGFAVLFTLIMCLVFVLYSSLGSFLDGKRASSRTLRVTIPEDLNYTDLFEDIFDEYTTTHRLEMVKTTNMGSMFRLTYSVTLKKGTSEKDFIDKLRTRNGNLEISMAKADAVAVEL